MILGAFVCFIFSLFFVLGTPISGLLLMAKSLQLHPIVFPNDTSPSSLKAETGWLKRFKDRHGIRALSIQGESLSAVTEDIDCFKDRLSKIMEEKCLTLNQVFNCDETGLYWKLMPDKTLVSSREKETKGLKKNLKIRVTLTACANANGSIKLPLVLIHKSARPRCFKHIDIRDRPVHYYALKSSWMDSTIFTKWFHQQFVPECHKALNEKGIAPKALLGLDNTTSHPDISSISFDDGQITCLYLPLNTTSLLQPMDQGVLQTLKCLYKHDLLLRMLDEECNGSMNFAQFLKAINIKDPV